MKSAEVFALHHDDFPDFTEEEFHTIQQVIVQMLQKHKKKINCLQKDKRESVWAQFLAYAKSPPLLRVYRYEHNHQQALKLLTLLMGGNFVQQIDAHIQQLIETAQWN